MPNVALPARCSVRHGCRPVTFALDAWADHVAAASKPSHGMPARKAFHSASRLARNTKRIKTPAELADRISQMVSTLKRLQADGKAQYLKYQAKEAASRDQVQAASPRDQVKTPEAHVKTATPQSPVQKAKLRLAKAEAARHDPDSPAFWRVPHTVAIHSRSESAVRRIREGLARHLSPETFSLENSDTYRGYFIRARARKTISRILFSKSRVPTYSYRFLKPLYAKCRRLLEFQKLSRHNPERTIPHVPSYQRTRYKKIKIRYQAPQSDTALIEQWARERERRDKVYTTRQLRLTTTAHQYLGLMDPEEPTLVPKNPPGAAAMKPIDPTAAVRKVSFHYNKKRLRFGPKETDSAPSTEGQSASCQAEPDPTSTEAEPAGSPAAGGRDPTITFKRLRFSYPADGLAPPLRRRVPLDHASYRPLRAGWPKRLPASKPTELNPFASRFSSPTAEHASYRPLPARWPEELRKLKPTELNPFAARFSSPAAEHASYRPLPARWPEELPGSKPTEPNPFAARISSPAADDLEPPPTKRLEHATYRSLRAQWMEGLPGSKPAEFDCSATSQDLEVRSGLSMSLLSVSAVPGGRISHRKPGYCRTQRCHA
jgi:hypothetical protein